MAFETLRAKLELDPSGFKQGIQEAEQNLDGLGSRTERVGQKMQGAGTLMTGAVTAPLVAMGAMAVKQTGTFNQAMAESMSVMGDVSDAMEEDLRDTAREVATATEHSHQQSAKALYFLSSAGLDAAESMEALPAAADFATAGQMRLEQATSILTTTMKAYGRDASEMEEITNTLAATVADSNTTMNQMSTAMSQVGPVAASLGVGLDETAAAIGAISNAGVQGERAGTALRNVMSQLSDETSTASTQLREMGVQTRDAQGNLLPMVELLRNMESAGVDAGQAAQIFGMEAAPAMAALMEQGAGSLQQFTEEVRNAEGATKEMSEIQRNTLNSEMQILRSNVNDLGIAFGTTLVPSIKNAAGMVRGATDQFRGLDDSQKRIVVGMLGLAAAIGPVVAGLGTLGVAAPAVASGYGMVAGAMATASATTSAYATSLLTTLIPASAVGQTSLLGLAGAALTAQVALGPITVPIYALVAAIGALVGAAAGLYVAWNNNVLGIKDTTQAAFQRVKRWFTNAPAWMLVLLGPLGQLYLGWRENLFGIQDITDKVFGFIGDKISWLRDQIERIPGIGEEEIAPDTEDVVPEPDKVAGSGSDAGTSWKESFEQEATPSVTPDTGGPIKGEMTPEIRAALKDGVDGYSSEDIEDAPTKINEELFNAVAANGGATAENLGVSEAEFQALMRRYTEAGSTSGSSTRGSSTPSADLMNSSTPTRTRTSSGGMSVEEFKTALRQVLDGFRLETRLETDQRGFEQFIEDIADAQLAEATSGAGRP